MAEVNPTNLDNEKMEVLLDILERKRICEANVVSILYKKPECLYDLYLEKGTLSNNIWKVYYQIIHDLVLVDKIVVIDDVQIGIYLDKHPSLREKYFEYGGYETIKNATGYCHTENYEGYLDSLYKWYTIEKLVRTGFPVSKEMLSTITDLPTEEIYDKYEGVLNKIFSNVSSDVKEYNALSGLHELINSLDDGSKKGLPLYNCDILTAQIGGACLGNIYGLGANSGIGKSTTVINYLIPSIIKENEQIVFFINEEDQTKIQKELLVWVANNIYHEDFQKHILRDGGYTEEIKTLLHKCADWLEEKKDDENVLVVPLERYSVNIVIKLIKRYASRGIKYFVLDTLKESFDSNTDEIYKSMTRDMVKLYDVIKPSAKNVCLFVTYQLGKGSIKIRHYSNNDIGLAKSIVDVMSVNLMIRRPFDNEFEGGLKWRRYEEGSKTVVPKDFERDKHYMITFITKNRFGATDEFQIVSEYDMSRNVYKDIGICNVPQDWS